MKIAIMQPYFAPYLGYFQLINAVDKFIFYDDVNYIKGGWINKNFITVNGNDYKFTIPLKKSSSFKKINEIEVNWECRDMGKLQKTLYQRFSINSPSREIIKKLFKSKPLTIADLTITSIILISNYLGINTIFERSSNYTFERVDNKLLNLVSICNISGANTYINPIGGQELYSKEEFKQHNINLNFIKGQSSKSLLDLIDSKNKEYIINELHNFKLI
tara:strand:- start:50 stop:703 length:654 start_codon:yes stop_codon:yes gene_type:complete